MGFDLMQKYFIGPKIHCIELKKYIVNYIIFCDVYYIYIDISHSMNFNLYFNGCSIFFSRFHLHTFDFTA